MNSPLSDEDCDEDEDDFKNIKFLIGKNQKSGQEKAPHIRKNYNISQTSSQNEIEQFLLDNNLSQLSSFINSLNLNDLTQLKSFSHEEIKQYLGPEKEEISKNLIEALNKLKL